MRLASLVAIALSALLVVSVVSCGLWIRAAGSTVDESSIQFHVGLGLVTVTTILVTLILNWMVIISRPA